MDPNFIKSIYHERQEPGSMLCAQHALNNLLQSAMFTAQDLAGIAHQLDQLEAAQLDAGAFTESQNMDDSGFFSLGVMEDALVVLGLRLVRWKSPEMKDVHEHPERMEGFILNHQSHWYAIRRFAISERFYNLDSCIPKPQWISPTYLGLALREAENQGYSIFAVVPVRGTKIGGLPPCDAADLAATLPPPNSRGDGLATTSSSKASTSFSGTGHTLGGPSSSASTSKLLSSASASSSSSTLKPSLSSSSAAVAPPLTSRQSSKRVAIDDPRDSADTDGSDDDVIIVDHSASASSVEEDDANRSRRRRRVGDRRAGAGVGGGEDKKLPLALANPSASPAPVDRDLDRSALELSEEDQMALAIAESLRASKLGGGDTPSNPDKGKVREKQDGRTDGVEPLRRNRGQEEEDAQLAAALKASLEVAGGAGQGQEGEEEEEEEGDDDGEDDTPTLDELRQRRLARFGA